MICAKKKFGQAREVDLERLFVEGNSGEAKKVVLEVVQVPGDGLAIEARARVADFVVEVTAGLYLETRQDGDNFSVGFDDLRAIVSPERLSLRNSKSVVSPRSSSR